MSERPKIAMIAVRPRSSDAHEAVIIGTGSGGSDWRYALCDLDKLSEALNSKDPFDPKKSPVRFFPNTGPERLTATEEKDTKEAFRRVGGEAWANTRILEARTFRNVVRWLTFRGAHAEAPVDFGTLVPLARLDTCGLGTPVTNPAQVGPRDSLSSNLVIFPDLTKPTVPGALDGFSAYLESRIALSGHVRNGDPAKDFARFDPRFFMRLVGIKQLRLGDPERDLWRTGAKFDLILTGITRQTWISGDEDSSRSFDEAKQKDLIDIVLDRDQPEPFNSTVEIVPAFHDLEVQGLLDGHANERDWKPTRRAGFRVVGASKIDGKEEVSKDEVTQLGLRFEAEFPEFTAQAGGALLAEPIFERVGPGDYQGPSKLLVFAQEQRVGDITTKNLTADTTPWLLTIRVDREDTRDLTRTLMKQYEAVRARAHDGLRAVRDALPLSVLPVFSEAITKPKKDVEPAWQVVGQIVEHESWRRRTVVAQQPSPLTLPQRSTRVASFEPMPVKSYWRVPVNFPPLAGTAAFPRVTMTDRSTPEFAVEVGMPEVVDADAVDTAKCIDGPAYQPPLSQYDDLSAVDVGTRFSVKLTKANVRGTIDIGALRLSLADPPPPNQGTGFGFRSGVVVIRGLAPGQKSEVTAGIDAFIRFPVDQVDPAGQDDPESAQRITAEDRRGRVLEPRGAVINDPLMFEIGKAASGSSTDRPAYSLSVSEVVTRDRNHTVAMSLRALKTDEVESRPRLVLAIHPEPFRVAAVEYVDPSAATSDQSNEVAVWNAAGEGGLSWRVLDQTETVRLLMPPQVIGEAMEKNRSHPKNKQRPADIDPNTPAAARFGANTRVEIDPTFADAFFREPGWNLRRILGHAGQRTPGSRLRDLRLELLYGMTARIAAPSEVWLSELEGIIGAAALKLSDTAGTDQPHVKRQIALINKLIDLQRRRVAVDKLWKTVPADDFAMDERVTFRLRTKDPKEPGGPTTKLRWPVPGEIPPDASAVIGNTFAVEAEEPIPGKGKVEPFPGGVAWAFESANILMSVYRNTASDAGRVQGLYISSLGGYGSQRALFDEKRTAVETDTTQGRVQRYRLERIGRIGGLWHKAKHVIVYERTVVPSAQFVNDLPIGIQQDEHSGRPILRKVEEFVELIQQKRMYPEDGTSVAAAGCLLGVEFKAKKIRVDSRWGGDVRREGWQVPLWNKAFAVRTDPLQPDSPGAIYPKPQIDFLAAGEGGKTVELEVSEPEKLTFYTSVVVGESGDNTDTWRPVRDIDFVDLPFPIAGKVTPQSKDLSDAILPPEPRQVPGFERLTIGVTPAKIGAAISHGRHANGPVAILKNMTISRGTAVSAPRSVPRDAAEVGPALASAAANLRAEIDRVAGRVLGPIEALDPRANETQIKEAVDQGKRALDDTFSDLDGQVNKLRDAVRTAKQFTGGQPCARLRAVAREHVQAQAERLNRVAVSAIRDTADRVDAPLATLAGGLDKRAVEGTVGTAVEALRLSFKDGSDIVVDGARRALVDVRENLTQIRRTVTADVSSIARQAGVAIDEVTGDTHRQLEVVEKLVKDAPARIKAATTFDDALRIAREVHEQVGKLVEQIGARLAEGPPEPVKRVLLVIDDVLRRAHAAIAAGIKSAAGSKDKLAQSVQDQVAAITSVLDALGTRIKSLSTELNTHLGTIVKAIDGMLGESLAVILDEKTGVLAAADVKILEIRSAIDKLDPLGDPKKLVEALNVQAEKARQAIKSARSALDGAERDASAAVTKLLNDNKDAIDKAIDQIATTCDKFEGKLDEAIQKIDDWLEQNVKVATFKNQLREAIEDAQKEANNVVDDLKRRATAAAAQVTREVEGRTRELAGAVQQTVRDAVGTDPAVLGQEAVRVYQQGSETLRLIRAVGDPPKTDSLGFNRPEVAYVLNEVNKVVDMTPAIALVNRAADTVAAADQAGKAVGDLLQSFGVRLPASGIGEQLLPDKLRNLSVASLLPDMAGIDFRGLLQRAGFPDIEPSNAMRIRHGFDKAEMRAWLEADIDVPFTEPATLLEFGPVQIVIDEARFVSSARITAGRDGNQRSMKGRISGDWRVVSSGMTMLTFRQTGLHFDDSGRIDFKIQPEKVELAAALQFLTSFLKATGKKGELVIEPFMRGGIPAGVAATLDMELPPIQLGVFGISDLSLHVLFGIAAVPQFEIVSELSVSTKVAPFTLQVWILNGGGFLTQRLSYLPMAKPPIMTYTLEVGIVAGVGLGFSFGVVSGGVWLQVGCAIAITWTTRAGGNTTAITVFILARGNVDVAGLITAAITLLLEVTYDGAAMIGAGTLSITVKISVFFTLSIRQRVQYVFAGEKREAGSGSYAESQG